MTERPDPIHLADCVALGERVVSSAASVEDQDGFHQWRRSRNRWTAETAAVLAAEVGEHHSDAFKTTAVVDHPLSSWELAREDEVRAARAALDLLHEVP